MSQNEAKSIIKNPKAVYAISIIMCIVFINIQPLTLQLPVIIAGFSALTIFCTLIILIHNKGKIRIKSSQLPFCLMIIFFILSLLNTLSLSQSLKYILVYTLVIVIMLLLSTETTWFSMLSKLLLITSCIHVVITLISYFYTDLYLTLFLPILNDSSFTLSYIYKFNFHAGIAGQTGTNAFYISTGLTVIFSRLLSDSNMSRNKKSSYIILAMIFLLALVVTGKRGLLLANLFALTVLYYIKNKNKSSRYLNYFVFTIISFVIGYISYIFIPAVNRLISFWVSSFGNSEDLSSGRIELYKFAWENFLSNPFKGIGIDAFTYLPYVGSYRNIGAHNDILQFSAEIGLIGTVTFIIIVLTVYIRTIRLAKNRSISSQYKPFLYVSLYGQSFILFNSLTGMPFHNYSMLLMYMIFISIPYAVQIRLQV